MPTLRGIFETLGHNDVSTYLQSGNVVFSSSDSKVASVTRTIAGALVEALGFEVGVLLRSHRQLGAIAKANPFTGETDELNKLHVTFLDDTPSAALVKDVPSAAAKSEKWSVVGTEVFLYLPDGYGRTKLNNAFFEKSLSCVGTTRNWRTVLALHEMTG